MPDGLAHSPDWLTQVRGAYHELQTRQERTLPPWAYRAFYPVKIALRALDEFRRNHGATRASGLAFVTLLALVPLSVVMFQLMRTTAIFAEKQQETLDWLFGYLVPTKSGEVQQFLLGTVGERSANLTPLALGLIVVTCLLLLNTIESTFNAIWGVRRARPLNRRIVAYWTVLTMPVLLVGLSFVISVWASEWLRLSVGRLPAVYALSVYVLTIIPTWLGFTCAYLFVPYTSVRPRAAFVGGVVAGTVWELSKSGYLTYSRTMLSNIETLYGPLSTIPVTLIWIYVSWLVVIFGAEIVFAVQFPDTPGDGYGAGGVGQRAFREYYAVRVMAAIVRHYVEGSVAQATSHELAAQLETPPEILLPLLDDLRHGGLALQSDDEAWIPARPPDTITVQHVIAATGERQFGVPDSAHDAVSKDLRAHFGEVRANLQQRLTALSLTDFARGGDA